MYREQLRFSRFTHIAKINSKLDLQEILNHLKVAISEEIAQCSVCIYLSQPDGSFKSYTKNQYTLPETNLLFKEVFKTKKTIYIPDITMDNRPNLSNLKTQSLLVVPIAYEDKFFGLVILYDKGIPMNLSDCEIQNVEAYINMAGVAIENTNNLKYKEHVIKEKQLLLDAIRDLSMCSSMQEGLDKCFSYLAQILHNNNIGIHLLDPVAANKIKPTVLSKDSDWTEEDWIKTHNLTNMDPSNDLVMQEVYETKKAIFIPDVFKDDRPNLEACRNFGIRSLLMLPLISIGENIGQICVANLGEEVIYYSESELQLAQSIIDATAATLSNLLYMEKQESIIKDRTSEIMRKNEELKDVVDELKQLSREKELILNSAGEGIFGLDLQQNITFCNPAGAKMLGYDTEGDLIGVAASSIMYEDYIDIPANELEIDTNYVKEYKFLRKGHFPFPVEYVISPIKEEDTIVGFVVTFKDITQRKLLEEKITYHAYFDSLTELPNRVLFTNRLTEKLLYAKENREKLAVLYLDLDRFKYVNDSLGHSFGDQLLTEVSKRLCDCLPTTATLSRQGGDEFAIFLPNIQSEDDILNVVNNIIFSISEPFNLLDQKLYIKTSIGISLYPYHGETTDMLIKNADIAMYKSKEITGNSYHFYSKNMNISNIDQLELENDLYTALEQDEFVLFYQPQINYKTNQLVGVEALLRWQHPKKGMISPEKFIPIAEETGLILPIGEWVLSEACKQMKAWHKQGFSLKSMSVNLSVRQFEQYNLFSIIKNILDTVELAPEYLHLELTENLIVKNTTLTLKTMKQLNALGINLAIDDFGTGYSSLGYLKKLPISTLKIDKSFVQDMIKDEAAITNTIIALSQNLKLDVIAEGVETKEQAEFLLTQNCYVMQGYFFSKPMAANDFTQKNFTGNSK